MAMSATIDRLKLSVDGMHCAGCAVSAQARLSKVRGVERATVDFASGIASIDGGGIVVSEILDAVRSAGFEPVLHGSPSIASDPLAALIAQQAHTEFRQITTQRQWFWRMLIAGVIWIALETLHWTMHHSQPQGWTGWTLFIGAGVALIVAGGGFFASAWRAARHGTTNMDTLVVLGVCAAFVMSAWIFLAQQFWHSMMELPLYFAESTALLAIISCGHWLEARGTSGANSAVKELLRLQPETVERVRATGEIESVALAAIQVGDRIRIRPGGRIAVDGLVLEGQSSIDESSLTGEPMPVVRRAGDSVSSGTIAIDGALVVRTLACGGASALGRIAQLVCDAQLTQAPIARHADRICRIFVPVVILIAVATFVAWLFMASVAVATVTAVTVLVISCPCALGIATPLAVMVATGEASRRGILIRSAGVFEAVAAVKTVVFDKTGTVTSGHPKVQSISVMDQRWTQDEVLALAAGAEAQSEHPLAKAIVSEARVRGLEIPSARDFKADPGVGVHAIVDGKSIGVLRDESASARIEIDGVVAARLVVVDAVRSESRSAVQALRDLGCQVMMLTGDRTSAALQIADAVGLQPSEVLADQTPRSKVDAINQRGASTVMMVGDGINDAGALTAAGVGVAMGGGTALAAASADAILMRDDPRAVAELIGVARAALAVIRQNLGLAFVYNIAAIPLAAFGVLGSNGPIIAAIAMGLSDISVVGNTLRLRAKLARQRRSATSGSPLSVTVHT